MGGVHVIPDKDEAGNIINTGSPFASKNNLLYDGHGHPTGETIDPGQTKNIDFTTPNYVTLFNGLEVFPGEYGDEVLLQIIDTELGAYSGNPDHIFNQFGTNWRMRQELIKQLPYQAKLLPGMRIRVVYKNNGSAAKHIHCNYDLHKVETP